MIESLSIRNFKILREVDLELKPLTVIVGPNASGKSSILQAVSLCLNGREGPTHNDLDLLQSRASQSALSITARVDGADIEFPIGSHSSSVDINRFIAIQNDSDVKRWKSVLLDLDPRKLAAPSYPKNVSLSLPSDGEGLSSILAGLQLEWTEKFSQIVERLRTVVPNLRGVRIGRVLLKPETVGHEILFDMLGAEGIPARSASHGTLLTLGVLTALSIYDGPKVVLIDDLERALHPKAVASFIQQLRGIQNPQLQIVATSHSPYLIDCMEADEVLLTSLDDDGYAVVRPLTDHPEYERWKGFMSSGEFWSSVGEDWITQEKKATA